MSTRPSLTEELARLLNASPAGITVSASSSFFGGRVPGEGFVPVKPKTFFDEPIKVTEAITAARNEVAKPTRGAVLEGALREISVRAEGRTDPAVRLAAIETLVGEALRAFSGDDRTPDDPEDARESLDWRRSCDDAYTDGIVARKCGLGSADHGLRLDTERSRALASAYALGWSVADEAAAFEDVGEAARLLLKFGDADSRDALRAALGRLPCATEKKA